ncbi:HAMP domain-containing histidine kinase [Clostridium botulinum C]|uniref:histidine kinase n=2 Tax=Clostridium botulinum TaxID=1491 RepID=A0A9Q4TIJ6_CLOBO|nr:MULTISPECIES: HAMP domain-containing sensor histidine kinase [Clostridium]AYF53867.1 sensor histidine kinase [Clostridium novyi]MCD3195072.1 HAMP domain-containing histidine kinase [Clostridium botulinum C]MCD3200412.1 HAMP domain-containing histidine kinase [Clostridium botulinum C]MCD3205830.1 HAMP domain-containing histidine kinase [Clostridium botulinum C]MCD3208265.1 HAMP domain-containing histidine kinase [Clostridium botulinum C]
MFGLKRQNKKVYTAMFKQYILFVFLIIIVFVSGILVTLIGIGKLVSSKDYISDIQKFYKASSIVKSDYKNIDAGEITSVGGWVEILDKNKNVIYVIGNKKDSKKVYTEDEILTLIEENSDKNKVDTTYLHSIDIFYVGKKKYYCMVKIPPGIINIDIDKEGSTEEYIHKVVHKLFRGIIHTSLFILLVILFYALWTSRRIVKPLREILKGINKMTEGDYSARINFEHENEFSEIKEAFNFMARKIEQGTKEREKAEIFKQQLFTDISHDLKTPITSIQGYSKALYDGVVQGEEKKRRYIKTIYDKSKRLVDLVENVHELAKLGNGNYSIYKEEIDICEFLREIITGFYFEIENKKFDFEIDIPEEEILFYIDKSEMTRAISNIISNSLKYNSYNTKLKIQLIKRDNSIEIIIADDGSGIPDELKDIIFEAFTRADTSRITTGGTGLGLSIAKKIVEKHNGDISLEYNNEYKTIFKIVLYSK